MLGAVKHQIQKKLYNKCYGKYTEDVNRQKDRYGEFLKTHSMDSFSQKEIPAETLKDGWHCVTTANITVFFRNGRLSDQAAAILEQAFMKQKALMLAYAHEECSLNAPCICNTLCESNSRSELYSPWFKPGWSPDTLESNFYFGNVFAVRNNRLENADRTDVPKLADKLAAELWQTKNAIGAVDNILLRQETEGEDSVETYEMPALTAKLSEGASPMESLISIIIPSKDNPQVLHTCISSLREKTKKVTYEIVVVDNGSSGENRAKLEEMAKQEDFRYVYREMDFNFSAMCNLGAAKANGTFYLFLNDDMEIAEEDWLYKMLEKAVQCHVGAVGAKLLYPNSGLIQHAGVTNLKVGPAHKLLKEEDGTIHYHGKNRYVHDMLAVTAACLLVEKQKYEEAGGFSEKMAVAYNDVDFCFSLYEKGYYNVQRNDVVLYHHESLSRGDDNLSDEKWKRLLAEKEMLYERHPQLRGEDPFYSPYLAEHFSDYLCNYEYEYERRDCYTKVKTFRGKEPAALENHCLTVNVEHAEKQKKLDITEKAEAYWLEGWSYVLSTPEAAMDNCRYQRKVLLLGENGTIYEAQCLSRYRKDVEAILPEQTNVALAGFVCRLPAGILPPGSYTIAMLAKDGCSAQKLYRRTDAVLKVED